MMFGIGDMKSIAEAYEKVGESFKKDLVGVSNYIRTFAILTAENPRLSVKTDDGWELESERMTASENNERNDELRDALRRGRYVFRAVVGDYDGIEHPFMILNISLSAAKHLAAKFDQEAFIFAERKRPSASDGERGSNMEFSFYAVRTSHSPSKTKEFRHFDDGGFGTSTKTVGVKTADMYGLADSRSSIDYDPEAKSFFSRKGDFKFTIPFGKFNVDEAVELYRQRERDLGKRRFDELMSESLEDDGIGKVAWRRRIEILGEK